MSWGLFRSLSGEAEPPEGVNDVLAQIAYFVDIANFAFVAFCLLATSLYALWVGWKFASAKDDAARKNAKSLLIYALIGICAISVVFVITGVFFTDLFFNSNNAFFNSITTDLRAIKGLDIVFVSIWTAVATILSCVQSLLLMLSVYIGWQFMKADDDAKRKNAKQQLVYVFIGVASAILFRTVAGLVILEYAKQVGVPHTGG